MIIITGSAACYSPASLFIPPPTERWASRGSLLCTHVAEAADFGLGNSSVSDAGGWRLIAVSVRLPPTYSQRRQWSHSHASVDAVVLRVHFLCSRTV